MRSNGSGSHERLCSPETLQIGVARLLFGALQSHLFCGERLLEIGGRYT